MAVPSPSIKPLLVAGGTHRSRYVGAVGMSGTSLPGTKAQGVAFIQAPQSWLDFPSTALQVGDHVSAGGVEFEVVSFVVDGSNGYHATIRALNDGGYANYIAIGTPVLILNKPSSPPQPDGQIETATTGGFEGAAASALLHVDLTAFSRNLRSSRYFVEQLELQFETFDVGIPNVQPRILRDVDFTRDAQGLIEYLTLQVTSDLDANECMVTVTYPHTHMR